MSPELCQARDIKPSVLGRLVFSIEATTDFLPFPVLALSSSSETRPNSGVEIMGESDMHLSNASANQQPEHVAFLSSAFFFLA